MKNLKTTFEKKRILPETSALYAQDQDDVNERAICTILEKIRTMLIHLNLPYTLWPKIFAAACYLLNQLPTKFLDGKTPYESWYGHKPDLSNLQAYGCGAYIVDYKAKKKEKFASQAWAGTLIGYEAKNQ